MIKKILFLLLSIVLITAINASAQELDPGQQWLEELDAATADGLSIDVGKVFPPGEPDSFFDVFVETVLREGLPAGVVDPELGTPLTPDEVTAILQQRGTELRNTLGVVQTPTFGAVDLTPGAAVYKWGSQARWSKGPHTFDILTRAKVDQWIRATMNKSRIDWTVFKPGNYSTDCMYLNVHSNGKLRLTLNNYGPLVGPDGNTIPTEYALTDYIETPNDAVFQGQTTLGAGIVIGWVPDGGSGEADVGAHKLVKVWNYINVHSGVGPGLYSTPDGPSAVITVIAAGV